MDAEANIGEADGPKGEPQDAAVIHFDLASKAPWTPAFAGMTINSKAVRSRDWLELQHSKIVTGWHKARWWDLTLQEHR
jgi:hypothetical protein